MANATKNPGRPGRPAATTTKRFTVPFGQRLQPGDKVVYTSVIRQSYDVLRETTTPEVPEGPATYTLELSADEAQVLYDLTAVIAGNPGSKSRRGLTDKIGNALSEAGVEHTGTFGPNDLDPNARHLRFIDLP